MLKNIFFITLALVSTNLSASGFDSFEWGVSRTDIVNIRGTPELVSSDGRTSWTLNGEESISGYKIGSVTYMFKEGCSELKESISSPCSLNRGHYSFLNPSLEIFEDLKEKLTLKYGEPEEHITYAKERTRDASTGKIIEVVSNRIEDKEIEFKTDDGTNTLLLRYINGVLRGVMLGYNSASYINDREKEATLKTSEKSL